MNLGYSNFDNNSNSRAKYGFNDSKVKYLQWIAWKNFNSKNSNGNLDVGLLCAEEETMKTAIKNRLI